MHMNITAIKGIYDSNTYVVELDGVCIIVEAGTSLDGVKKALAGKTPSAIFLTHEHFDHIFHTAEYAEAFPDCKVYCHPSTLNELKTGEFNNTMSHYTGYKVVEPKTYKNFHALTDGQILKIDKFEIKAIFAPGHSHGSVVYLINSQLFTGDVLFRTSIGRTDLIPNGPELMQKSLRILQKVKFEICYNGHSGKSTFEQQQKNIAHYID